MTKALDAAIRAACSENLMAYADNLQCEWPACDRECGLYPQAARAALRAALPAEPPAEAIDAMAPHFYGHWEDLWALYRALRAHLLGEDA